MEFLIFWILFGGLLSALPNIIKLGAASKAESDMKKALAALERQEHRLYGKSQFDDKASKKLRG